MANTVGPDKAALGRCKLHTLVSFTILFKLWKTVRARHTYVKDYGQLSFNFICNNLSIKFAYHMYEPSEHVTNHVVKATDSHPYLRLRQ